MHALDVVASLAGLLVLSPLFLLMAMLVKLDSPGPIFYRAHRIGRRGRPFCLYKFRTMVADADRQGLGITSAGDARITPLGRFLRTTKIDELPQLINVLRGEMSLVGPRPEDPRHVALYTPVQRRVLEVRPGITSPTSIQYRHEEGLLNGPGWERTYLEEVMPHKFQIELEYLARRTFWSDLGVILQTSRALFQRSAPAPGVSIHLSAAPGPLVGHREGLVTVANQVLKLGYHRLQYGITPS